MAYNLGGGGTTGYDLGYTGVYTIGVSISAADSAVEAQSSTVTIADYILDPTELRLGGSVVPFTFSSGVLTYTAPLLPNNPTTVLEVDVDDVTKSTTIAYTNTYNHTHIPSIVDDNSLLPESSFGSTQVIELKVITDADSSILTVDWVGYDADNFESDVSSFVTANSEVAASTDVVIGYHITETGESGTFTRTLSVVDAGAPQGTIIFESISTGTTTTLVSFIYGDVDHTGFEYSLDGGVYKATESPISLKYLVADQQYSISIRAINSNGSGTPSTTTFTTNALDALAPQNIVLITSLETDEESITLNFAYADSDDTSFERRVNDGSFAAVVSPFTISGLNANTPYTITIRPVNESGSGPETMLSVKTPRPTATAEYVSPFNFQNKANQRKLVYTESDPIAVKGVLGSTRTASVNNGQLAVSTDGGVTYGPWGNSANVITGDLIKVRHITSNSSGQTIKTTLTIDDQSNVFSSVTTTPTHEPDIFSFVDKVNVVTDKMYISNIITVQGVSSGTDMDISIDGGEYQTSINGSTWTSWTNQPGFVQLGNYVRVRCASSINPNDSVTARLWINSVHADFTTTTYTPSSVNRRVKVKLIGGVSATGLRYAVFKGTNLATAELISQGANGIINNDGEFTLNVTNSILMVGDSVIVVASNFQGAVNQISRSAYIVGTITEVK